MEPFVVINRGIILTREDIYMVECEKFNTERDSFLLRRIFLDIESARESQMQLWQSEVKQFDQFTDFGNSSIPAGKTVEDYVQRDNYHIGWDCDAIERDDIMGQDDWGEMNWDSDYGLTTGYSIIILSWDANANRYD
jgi:hypothetical protein